MRALALIFGGFVGGGFVLLGSLVLIMGEGQVPLRRAGNYSAHGLSAYAMGVGWIGLGLAFFCIGLLGANIGSAYYVRWCRDASFLLFAIGFVAAVALGIKQAYAIPAL